MVFQDETGFSLHPRLGRVWAKKGQRFRVPTTSQHQHRLNVSGWVAPLLGRHGMIRTERGNRQGFLKVLRHIYRCLKSYTIWLYVDRARWHKGEPVDKYVSTHKRLHLDFLPPYQPGLNPQERIWKQIRYESTSSRWHDDIETIRVKIQKTSRSWSTRKVLRLCNIN